MSPFESRKNNMKDSPLPRKTRNLTTVAVIGAGVSCLTAAKSGSLHYRVAAITYRVQISSGRADHKNRIACQHGHWQKTAISLIIPPLGQRAYWRNSCAIQCYGLGPRGRRLLDTVSHSVSITQNLIVKYF